MEPGHKWMVFHPVYLVCYGVDNGYNYPSKML